MVGVKKIVTLKKTHPFSRVSAEKVPENVHFSAKCGKKAIFFSAKGSKIVFSASVKILPGGRGQGTVLKLQYVVGCFVEGLGWVG